VGGGCWVKIVGPDDDAGTTAGVAAVGCAIVYM